MKHARCSPLNMLIVHPKDDETSCYRDSDVRKYLVQSHQWSQGHFCNRVLSGGRRLISGTWLSSNEPDITGSPHPSNPKPKNENKRMMTPILMTLLI